MTPAAVDAVLVRYGEPLFAVMGGRRSRTDPPALPAVVSSDDLVRRAMAVRDQIARLTSPGATQAMARVTGGGRGLRAIGDHLRYISGGGERPLEDEQGQMVQGAEATRRVLEAWRGQGPTQIPPVSSDREAINMFFAMPRGTSVDELRVAVRSLAAREFAGHHYVMALHDHQSHPHVHVCVRTRSKDGRHTLKPGPQARERWRAEFAIELQGRGVEAVATRQATHVASRASPRLWQVREADGGQRPPLEERLRESEADRAKRLEALQAWALIKKALDRSPLHQDQQLSQVVTRWLAQSRDAQLTREMLGVPEPTEPYRRAGRSGRAPER